MQYTKENLYQKVKDIVSKEQYEQEIQKRYTDYDELFNLDTIALLYIDELGKNTQCYTTISQLTDKTEHVIQATVTQISELKTFSKKNGSTGRVQNIQLADDTGTCRLVLWDEHIKYISEKNISIGTKIKIINGYVKQGYSGLEISLGKWGLLETIQQNTTTQPLVNQNTIKGVLSSIDSTKAFFKDNGEFGFVTTITIQNKQGDHHITVWDDKVKEIQQYSLGDSLEISNISCKSNNGHTELHVNGSCSITKN